MSSEQSRQRHRFQETARRFRAGKISLAEFADEFFPVAGETSARPGEPAELYRRLSPRPADCHKGTFGHVLVVAGSLPMSGAAALCGLAALRGGAGMVTVATGCRAQPIVARYHPCLMTAALPDDENGYLTVGAWAQVAAIAERATCLAIGPGLGQTREVRELVRTIYRNVPLPMIVDADALNALAADEELPPPGGPRIYTPHPGELQRLVGTKIATRDAREQAAVDWLGRFRSKHPRSKHPQVLVLKGEGTLVLDGERAYRNSSGSPVLATAGTGDVLCGLIAALVAQRLPCWDAAALGVHVHGYAGELAAGEIGPVGVVASDVLDRLPAALTARGLDGPPPPRPPAARP